MAKSIRQGWIFFCGEKQELGAFVFFGLKRKRTGYSQKGWQVEKKRKYRREGRKRKVGFGWIGKGEERDLKEGLLFVFREEERACREELESGSKERKERVMWSLALF